MGALEACGCLRCYPRRVGACGANPKHVGVCGAVRLQAYYDKGPDKVFNLRVDTLAIALNLANVAAGNEVGGAPCRGVVGWGSDGAGFATKEGVEDGLSSSIPYSRRCQCT